MYFSWRRYLGLCLAVLLVLTSQSMAVARGVAGPVGQMVLCTGTGPVIVAMDENGEPAAAPHYCPDCALALVVTVVATIGAVWSAPQLSVDYPIATAPTSRKLHQVRALARAPPLPV